MKEDAEVLRRGIALKLLPVARAVAWADRRIAEAPIGGVPPVLYDVALAGALDTSEASALLAAVPGGADRVRVTRRLLGLYAARYAACPADGARVARALYQLALGGDLPEATFGHEAFFLDEYFDESGLRTPEQAAQALETYFSRWALAPERSG